MGLFEHHPAIVSALEDFQIYVVATGGGASIQQHLWEIPNTSQFLVGCSFPYDRSATEEFLGFSPEKFVSRKTAIQLAQEAFMRACRGSQGKHPAGIGITASVASTNPHRGQQQAFVCIVDECSTQIRHITFENGVGTGIRLNQNSIIEDMLVGLFGTTIGSYAGRFKMGDEIPYEQELLDVLYENPVFYGNGARGKNSEEAIRGRILFPGSFNPVHFGHQGIASFAEQHQRLRVTFLLSCDSVHKKPLRSSEVLKRVSEFRKWPTGHELIITKNDPLFVDKCEQFPNHWFVMGADSMRRFLEPQWYPDRDIEKMLQRIEKTNCRFLVNDRDDLNSDVIDVPARFRYMFGRMPVKYDISSTKIREKKYLSPGVFTG